MYCGRYIVIECQDRQRKRLSRCDLSSCRCDILNVAVAESCSNQEFWGEVLHYAKVEGNDKFVQTEV